MVDQGPKAHKVIVIFNSGRSITIPQDDVAAFRSFLGLLPKTP